jgi:hypothetical protein
VKVLLWVIGIPVGIFVAMFLYFFAQEVRKPPVPVEQRIAEECQRQYATRGELEVNKCRLDLSSRYLLDREQEKRDAAYKRIR